MKVILHCGTEKTGTTSLQKSLGSAQRLLLRHGILYPRVPYTRDAHHILSAGYDSRVAVHPNQIRKAGGLKRLQAASERGWRRIETLIRRHRPHTLVLSSEVFFELTAKGHTTLRDRLHHFSSEIQPCVYIREPAAKYLSSIQQLLKHHLRFIPPIPFTFRENLEQMEAVYDLDLAVCPFASEQLRDGDIIQDFAARFLGDHVDRAKIATRRLNRSVSAEALSILDHYRRHIYAGVKKVPKYRIKTIREAVARLERRYDRFHKPRLQPHVANAIRGSSKDLSWLRERYRIRFEGVDGQTATGSLEEFSECHIDDIIEVDQQWRGAILYQLLHTRLRSLKSLVREWPLRSGRALH